MKKIYLLALAMTLSEVNPAFAADEIHWTITGNNSVTFDWRGASTENSIGYGLTSGNYTRVTAAKPNPAPVSSAGSFWEAKLTGLTANTRYFYKIGNQTERSFLTAPTLGSSNFNVYAQGNIGSTSKYFNTGVIQDIIANDLPSFVVGLGDLTLGSDNGKASIDQHFNDVMVWSREAAYMPVWGDKDAITSTNESFKNYKGRFAVPNPQTSPGSPLAGSEDWHWFDYGNARFITLPEPWTGAWADWNTKAGALMAQAQANSNIKFIVTFVHRPAYSSGHYSGSPALKNMLDKLGDTYSKYKLNINAHSNNYERSFPQHGVTHITAGTGGANLAQDGACLWLTCAKPSWSAFRAMHLGALKLQFTASNIKGSFICGPAGGGANNVNCTKGSVVDSFTIGSAAVAAGAVSNAAPALPDVIVTSISYANGVFTSTVKNQGTAATPSGTFIGVGYSVDGVWRTWGSVNNLAAGASVTIGTNGARYAIPTGTHTISAYVDDINRFAEANETNNQRFQSVTVGAVAPPPPAVDTQAPTIPINLRAVAASSSQINLSWTASTDNVGVTGYRIFRNGIHIATVTGTSYSNTGLAASTAYAYTVSAYDRARNSSAQSSSVSSTTSPGRSSAGNPFFGFAAHYWGPYPNHSASTLLNLIQESGAGLYRVDLTTGTYALTDALLAAADTRNIKLLAILQSPDASYTSAYNEARAFSSRYAGRISYYQISNEQDLAIGAIKDDGSLPTDFDNAQYQQAKTKIQGLLDGVRAGDPNAKAIINFTWLHYGFIQRLINDGLNFDIIGIDWYSDMGNISSIRGTFNLPAYIKSQFGKPLWVTEGNIRYGSMNGNEGAQATYVSQTATASCNNPNINAYIVYELLDEPGAGGTGEPNYGLLYNVTSPKPAFNAYKQAIAGCQR